MKVRLQSWLGSKELHKIQKTSQLLVAVDLNSVRDKVRGHFGTNNIGENILDY